MTLDLRKHIRGILDTSPEADPGEIAKDVLASLRPAQIKDALEQTLRLFVRQVITETRKGASPAAPIPIRRTPSAKVAAIRENWKARLRDRYHVGNGEWKFLADMDHDNLLAAAAERREMAERNAAWAELLDSWAALLIKHGVQTFGELPEVAQMDAVTRAAA